MGSEQFNSVYEKLILQVILQHQNLVPSTWIPSRAAEWSVGGQRTTGADLCKIRNDRTN